MENYSPESTFMLTPSEVIEHLYCPRFTYFMNCLAIPQHEEFRYKVILGREAHKRREKRNRGHLRKKINCVSKEVSVYLASPLIRVRGIVDEILHFSDGSLAPLDYKFTEYRDYTFKTHRIQSVLYAMLIKDTYKKPVNKGYICYERGGAILKEILYNPSDFSYAEKTLDEISKIVTTGYYPGKTRYSTKCIDCCYKNICV